MDFLIDSYTAGISNRLPTFIGYGDTPNVGTSAPVPAHQAGDRIVMFMRDTGDTPPAVPSGWTNVASASGSGIGRGLRIVTIVDAANTITEINATVANQVGFVVIRGGGGIGAASISAEAVMTAALLPTLTLQTPGQSLVLAGASANQVAVSYSAPSDMTYRGDNQSPTELGGGRWGIFLSTAYETTFTGRTAPNSTSAYTFAWAVELRAV
jgi:hypothetical protein